MGGMPVIPSMVQEDFRVRDGDPLGLNSDAAASWLEAINTDATYGVDIVLRIRFQIAEVNGANFSAPFDVNFNHNGGGYTPVGAQGAGSIAVEFANSIQFTDGDATTDVLPGGSGSFTAGEGVESQPFGGYALNGEHTEVEAAIKIIGSEVADTDTILFRIGEQGSADNSGGALRIRRRTPQSPPAETSP